MKSLGPRGGIPADIPVPVSALPGRRAKEHARHRTSLVIDDEVLEVLPHRTAVTQVMMPVEQVFKQGARGAAQAGAHFTNRQRQQLVQRPKERQLRKRRFDRRHLLMTDRKSVAYG